MTFIPARNDATMCPEMSMRLSFRPVDRTSPKNPSELYPALETSTRQNCAVLYHPDALHLASAYA